MSDATRAVALDQAVKVVGSSSDVDTVLAAAIAFNDFLVSDTAQPQNPPKTSTAGPEPTKPVKQPKAAKTAPPKKLVPEDTNPEEEAAAELSELDEDDVPADAPIPPTLEGVKAAVALMLSSNKRKEAVTLLKKFKAASATSVKAKDYAAFVAEAQQIAGPAEEASDDLTA